MGEDPNVLEGTMKVTTPKFKSMQDDEEENANIAETLASLHDAEVDEQIQLSPEETKESIPVVNQDEIVLIEAQNLIDDDDLEG